MLKIICFTWSSLPRKSPNEHFPEKEITLHLCLNCLLSKLTVGGKEEELSQFYHHQYFAIVGLKAG